MRTAAPTDSAASLEPRGRGARSRRVQAARKTTSTATASHADRVSVNNRYALISAPDTAQTAVTIVRRLSNAKPIETGSVISTNCAATFLLPNVAAGGKAWGTQATFHTRWVIPSRLARVAAHMSAISGS